MTTCNNQNIIATLLKMKDSTRDNKNRIASSTTNCNIINNEIASLIRRVNVLQELNNQNKIASTNKKTRGEVAELQSVLNLKY